MQYEAELDKSVNFFYTYLEDSKGDKQIISSINKKLENSRTRLQGYEQLQMLLPHCREDLLLENIQLWLDHCTNLNPDSALEKIKLKTLYTIIENVSNPEILNKNVTKQHLNFILQTCLKFESPADKTLALKYLEKILKKFPVWFGNHKETIETFLIDNLNNDSVDNCFISYLQIGSSGNGGINYINNFTNNFGKIYWTIQNLLNEFFKQFVEINDNFVKIDGEFFYVNANTAELIFTKIVRFLGILRCLVNTEFPVVKTFQPFLITNIIERGVNFNYCFCNNESMKNVTILLKKLYRYLLTVLQDSIKYFNVILKPLTSCIQHIFLTLLRKSQQCKCSDLDFFYKADLYQTMNAWFLRNKLQNEKDFLKKVVPLVIKDVSVVKKEVVLNPKQSHEILYKSTRSIFTDNVKMTNFCKEGVTLLATLISSSCYRDNNLFKEMLDFVKDSLYTIQCGYKNELFRDPSCQIKLYEILMALLLSNNCLTHLTVHEVVGILNRGFLNSNQEIAQKCWEFLDICETISHSKCPTLYISENHLVQEQSEKLGLEDITECTIQESVENFDLNDGDTEDIEVVETPDLVMENNGLELLKNDSGDDDDAMFSSFNDCVQE